MYASHMQTHFNVLEKQLLVCDFQYSTWLSPVHKSKTIQSRANICLSSRIALLLLTHFQKAKGTLSQRSLLVVMVVWQLEEEKQAKKKPQQGIIRTQLVKYPYCTAIKQWTGFFEVVRLDQRSLVP